MISHILSHNLPGVTVDDGKQVCRSVLSMYLYILDIHLPDLIGCVNANNGFHNPPRWTAVIVCIVEEIVLLQYTEYLLPVDYISGSLQMFCDLLVTIADEFPAKKIHDIKQELFICNRDNSGISDPFGDRGGLSPSLICKDG